MNGNESRGRLIVRTFTALGTIAVPDATVTIIDNTDGNNEVVFVTHTDTSGVTSPIDLRTIPIEDATGKTTGYIVPHILYTVEINKNGFNTLVNQNVPVYENQTSIQTFNLIPSSNFEGSPNADMSVINYVADRSFNESAGLTNNESGGV